MFRKVSIDIKHQSIVVQALWITIVITLFIFSNATYAGADETNNQHILVAQDSRGVYYLADSQSGRLDSILQDGEHVTLAKDLGTPKSLVVDRQRNLFVGTAKGEVWAFSPAGQKRLVATGIETPFALSLDRDDKLFVINRSGDALRLTALKKSHKRNN